MKPIEILFRQNKYLNILHVAISMLFFFVVFVFIMNFAQSKIEIKAIKNFEGKNMYRVTDLLTGNKEKQFFLDVKGYDLLYKFIEELTNAREISLYTAVWQPIGIADFKGDQSFDPRNRYGETTPPHQLGDKTYSSVLSMQVNDAVLQFNNLQINLGKAFDQRDYLYTENSNLTPVILGNEYSHLYQLGDTIHYFLYGKEMDGKIIGFLKPSQKIMYTNQPEILLDRYVVLPSPSFDRKPSEGLLMDKNNELFVRASLLARTNSVLLSDLSPLKLRKIVEQVSENVGFHDFQVIGANSFAINALVSMNKTNIAFILGALFVLFLLSLMAFIGTISMKIKKNIPIFLVFLISGASMSVIKKNVRNDFLVFTMIGGFLPFILITFLSQLSYQLLGIYLLLMIGIGVFLYLFILVFVNRIFLNMDMVQQLKR